MAIPASPRNFYVQQGNGDVFLSWDLASGATSYSVKRSTDGITFSVLTSPTVNYYLDSTVTVGTQYYYQVASTNLDGTSSYTAAQSVVPTNTADLSLGQIRVMSQQRADRLGSNFVTLPEWNSYIVQSYFELYDLLVTSYEDYFVEAPYQFQTTGVDQYTLPTNFYKLMGVDIGYANAWISLQKFNFSQRNRYTYPQMASAGLTEFNPRYRLVGNSLMLIPTPSSGQTIQVWYIPKRTQPLQDTDILEGVSGWTEYVIVDAAIKALQKEESDVSVLFAQKQALIKRIEETSMNRDAGEPSTISDTRSLGTSEAFDAPNGWS